jgi:glutaredoxin
MALDVTLLTQRECGFCDQAKDVLARLEAEFPLKVRTVGLESPDGRALAERLGVLFAPGIVVDGELVAFGRLSERRLRREFARRAVA